MTRRYELFVFGDGDDYDSVVRLNRFRAAHPEWSVGYDGSADLWRAHRDLECGSETHVRYRLVDLLNVLESLPSWRGEES
jgi:hypothetical protein